MGAIYREEVVHALNVKDAWEILMEVEDRDYGTDSYNGSFNKCSLRRCLKKFDKWNDKTKKEVEEFMSTDEFDSKLEKWEADYIDCGVEEFFRDKLVKKATGNPAPKFENVFRLHWTDCMGKKQSKDFKDRPEAEAHILDLFYLNSDSIYLTKEKKAITDNKICDYSRETKTFKNRPKDNYKEMHRYIFVGYCPE